MKLICVRLKTYLLHFVNSQEKIIERRSLLFECFDLDVAIYKDARHAEDYLDENYKDSYKYNLFAFVFHPLNEVFYCENQLVIDILIK